MLEPSHLFIQVVAVAKVSDRLPPIPNGLGWGFLAELGDVRDIEKDRGLSNGNEDVRPGRCLSNDTDNLRPGCCCV